MYIKMTKRTKYKVEAKGFTGTLGKGIEEEIVCIYMYGKKVEKQELISVELAKKVKMKVF